MKKLLLIFAAVVCCVNVFAAEVVVKQLKYSGPYEFDAPYMADSTNVNGKKYTKAEFLKNYVDLDNVWSADAKQLDTDDKGKLPKLSTSKDAVHLVGFYLNTDKYCTAEMTVGGVKDFVLYVDGKQTAVANGKAKLNILPNSRHDFVIKYATAANDSTALSLKFDTKKSTANLVPTLDPQKRYSLVEVQHTRNAQSAHISHDGKWIILNFGERYLNGKTAAETHIIERASGKVLWSRPMSANQLRVMPKSNLAYYTRSDAKGQSIVTLDPMTGVEKVFASGLPSGNMTIAPTEDFLIFTMTEKGPEEKGDLRQVLSPEDRQAGNRSRRFLYKYDLKTGVATRLTYGHTSTSLESISHDGKKIVFNVTRFKAGERPFRTADVMMMDIATLKVDTLIKNESFLGGVSFSPDSKKLLISCGPESFGGIGLNIAEGQTANGYDHQLFVYDIASREVKPLTKDFDPNVKNAYWNKYDNLIYMHVGERDMELLYSLDPVKGTIKKVDLEEEYLQGVKLSSQSPYAVYYGMSLTNYVRVYTYDRKSRKSTLVADLSANLLKDVKLGETGDWNYESSQGGTIYGRYYLPANFDADKKYPMLVYYYAGTNPTARALSGVYSGHVFASMGYVVYVVQPSGATGFGQEFSARHVNAWGQRTADDIIEGVTKFCDEHQFVNREKIGCFGASYGGFMTQYLQTRTDIFAAAVSHAGISSIASYWGEGYWGYSYSVYATANNYPWNAPELYTMQSPLFNADKINTPILFLHGTADTNVPIGESIQMFTALKLLGKETAFVQVKDENHVIADYERTKQWSYTMYAWFAKWLQDSPDWWNAMYPPKDL